MKPFHSLFVLGCALFLAGGSIGIVSTLSPAMAFSASAQGLPQKSFAILPDKIPWLKNPDPDTRETAYPVEGTVLYFVGPGRPRQCRSRNDRRMFSRRSFLNVAFA